MEYGDIHNGTTELMFEAINEALDIELYEYQKHFILNGVIRQSGITTAYILRQLLQNTAVPLDLSTLDACYFNSDISLADQYNVFALPRRKDYGQIYKHEVLSIKEKLEAAGIPTRQVILTQKEFEEFLNENTFNYPHIKDVLIAQHYGSEEAAEELKNLI